MADEYLEVSNNYGGCFCLVDTHPIGKGATPSASAAQEGVPATFKGYGPDKKAVFETHYPKGVEVLELRPEDLGPPTIKWVLNREFYINCGKFCVLQTPPRGKVFKKALCPDNIRAHCPNVLQSRSFYVTDLYKIGISLAEIIKPTYPSPLVASNRVFSGKASSVAWSRYYCFGHNILTGKMSLYRKNKEVGVISGSVLYLTVSATLFKNFITERLSGIYEVRYDD